ncbi:MAG: nitroreductase family protein [Solirubrobacteraceae bacterium]|nr:nitroreductase family protein [Patulibacter sp.]
MIETILGRRSVREAFAERAVPEEVVRSIVSCGLAAPSSKNAQPWRLHVVTDRAILGHLARTVEQAKNAARYVPLDPATGEPRRWTSTVAESAHVLGHVPLAIFIENRGEFSSGRTTVAAATGDVLRSALVGYGFEMIGLGACIQTMWLAAEHHGLHGVFMGDPLIAEDEIRSTLGTDNDFAGVLCLGYADGGVPPKEYVDDLVVWHRPDETA